MRCSGDDDLRKMNTIGWAGATGKDPVRLDQEPPVRFGSESGFTNQPMTLVKMFSIGVSSGVMWNKAESSFQ